ncbi:type II secretion system protein J [Altericista sp. CCNU0014]|uniref:type II secretion system protein J n=1 Tax=Altericista sp. CCNU0014 TaxID=3082949 RepID=UPI00384AA2EA
MASPFPFQSTAFPRAVSIPSDAGWDRGFTLVEVIVAALVMTLLVSNLLAMVVYAGMFRLKARQSGVSRDWIQQDLENVKFNASQFKIAALSADAAAGATSVTVNRTNVGSISMAPGDTLKIGDDSVFHTISGISGTTLSFTPPLNTDQISGAQVWAAGASSSPKFCNATSSTTGLAQALAADLAPVLISSKTISGTSYTLSRTATPVNTAPYQTLTLTYSVLPSGGGAEVLSLQTKVVPYAAFGCP